MMRATAAAPDTEPGEAGAALAPVTPACPAEPAPARGPGEKNGSVAVPCGDSAGLHGVGPARNPPSGLRPTAPHGMVWLSHSPYREALNMRSVVAGRPPRAVSS